MQIIKKAQDLKFREISDSSNVAQSYNYKFCLRTCIFSKLEIHARSKIKDATIFLKHEVSHIYKTFNIFRKTVNELPVLMTKKLFF